MQPFFTLALGSTGQNRAPKDSHFPVSSRPQPSLPLQGRPLEGQTERGSGKSGGRPSSPTPPPPHTHSPSPGSPLLLLQGPPASPSTAVISHTSQLWLFCPFLFPLSFSLKNLFSFKTDHKRKGLETRVYKGPYMFGSLRGTQKYSNSLGLSCFW